MKNAIIIVAGPSGAGKSSFLDRLLGEWDFVEDIITYTTRPMRKGEAPGEPYHFVSEEKFEQLKSSDFFVEWAVVHKNFYGTPRDQIHQAWENDRLVIMDVDFQGARTIKAKYPKECFTIFINPPSVEALRKRVRQRDGDTVKDLEVRMATAVKEMSLASEFDAQLINEDFEASYSQFKKIIEEFLKTA